MTSLKRSIDGYKYWSSWLYFSPKGELVVIKSLESFSSMLYLAALRFVSKREGQIQGKFDERKFSNLTAHSA